MNKNISAILLCSFFIMPQLFCSSIDTRILQNYNNNKCPYRVDFQKNSDGSHEVTILGHTTLHPTHTTMQISRDGQATCHKYTTNYSHDPKFGRKSTTTSTPCDCAKAYAILASCSIGLTKIK